MTKQQKEYALERIESQLMFGYIDLGMNDEDEIKIIKDALKLYKREMEM